jgi:hypothetical protein
MAISKYALMISAPLHESSRLRCIPTRCTQYSFKPAVNIQHSYTLHLIQLQACSQYTAFLHAALNKVASLQLIYSIPTHCTQYSCQPAVNIQHSYTLHSLQLPVCSTAFSFPIPITLRPIYSFNL